MASIFGPKPTTPPVNEKRFADIELSISNRYKSLDDKIDSRIEALEKKLMQVTKQNEELLKSTFDVKRQVSNQIIDVENAAKKEFYKYETKVDEKLNSIDKIYATNEKFTEIGNQIVSAVKKLDKKYNSTDAKIDDVSRKIPQNTVDKKTVEDALAKLNDAIMNIANAIPKHTVDKGELARLEDQIRKMFDFYPTTDALISVEKDLKTNITKIAKTSAATSKESKDTKSEVKKLESTVKDIKSDYTPKSVIPSINKSIEKTKAELLQNDEAVKNAIPTDVIGSTEVSNIREQINTLSTELIKTKDMLNESMNINRSQIDSIVRDATTYFDNKVKELEKDFSDKSGIDSERMKNIIRDVADDEISILRNNATLLQENTKNAVLEVKNQNRNLANKVAELDISFNKLIALNKK